MRPEYIEDITPENTVVLTEHWRKKKITDRSIEAKLNGIQGIFSNGIDRKFYAGANPVPEARKLVRLKPKPKVRVVPFASLCMGP